MSKPSAIIVDLDGTLANCEHRRHHVDKRPKDWQAFFGTMNLDEPDAMVSRFIDLMAPSYRIVLLTGRSLSYFETTRLWLERHGIMWHELYMRAVEDYRPDHEVKEQLYREHIEPNFDVKLVLDDRASVVAMWRRIGLPCWQVAEGDF